MQSIQTEDFQKKVSALLVRNSNVIDILTKCQLSCGGICRSSVKAATGCGCIKITAKKSPVSLEEATDFSPKKMSGVTGKLCSECRSMIEKEIGETLFYIASLCNALDMSISDIMQKEIKNVEALGKYSLH